jgi:hypothetical protein
VCETRTFTVRGLGAGETVPLAVSSSDGDLDRVSVDVNAQENVASGYLVKENDVVTIEFCAKDTNGDTETFTVTVGTGPDAVTDVIVVTANPSPSPPPPRPRPPPGAAATP